MNQIIKISAGLLKLYSPSVVRQWINTKIQAQEVSRAMYVAQNFHISREEFQNVLQQLDLSNYSTVFLHTSVSNLGKIQGGAKFIAQYVTELVDIETKTLLVSALPFRGSFHDYLQEHDTFDVRNAPIAMGSVNEVLSNYSGSLRSIHPTHSVIALGPRARQFVDQHHVDPTPFGINSPYYKLIRDKGAVMLLGATLNNLTFVHAIEDLLGDALPFTPYSKRRFTVRCTDWDGREVLVDTPCHSPLKGLLRDVSRLERPLIECGALHSWSLGAGKVSLIDAFRFTTCYLDLMLQGKSIYGRHIVSKHLSNKIAEVKELLQNV